MIRGRQEQKWIKFIVTYQWTKTNTIWYSVCVCYLIVEDSPCVQIFSLMTDYWDFLSNHVLRPRDQDSVAVSSSVNPHKISPNLKPDITIYMNPIQPLVMVTFENFDIFSNSFSSHKCFGFDYKTNGKPTS